MKLAELLKKRWYIFLAAGFVLAACIVLIIILALNSTKKLSVAFYGVEEKIVENLSKEITKAWPKEVEFTVLSEEDGLSVEEAGKYDAVITWSGKKARILAQNAAEMPAKIYGGMPTSVQKAGLSGDKQVFLPLLYDYSPLFYSKSSLNRGFDEIADFGSFDEMEQKAVGEYAFSLYASGKSIDHFYGLISCITESICGSAGYRKLCDLIESGKDFEECCDEPLAEIQGEKITFRTVLEYIRTLQDDKILSGQWHSYSTSDEMLLMSEDEIYSISMPLDYYRTIPMRTAANYRPIRFPIANESVEHALVAPTVVMFINKKADKKQDLIKALVSPSVQERLSESTMLIPVSSQAGCYDIYADDGRFYAAGSFGGLVSTINKECFTTAQEEEDFKARLVTYLTFGK
ncbi:MAG: hypothetical protein J6Y60_01415 [Treponema sp.]|nr:hypothetical protein [Treponema sp.]